MEDIERYDICAVLASIVSDLALHPIGTLGFVSPSKTCNTRVPLPKTFDAAELHSFKLEIGVVHDDSSFKELNFHLFILYVCTHLSETGR